jgi:hypothetical protein
MIPELLPEIQNSMLDGSKQFKAGAYPRMVLALTSVAGSLLVVL